MVQISSVHAIWGPLSVRVFYLVKVFNVTSKLYRDFPKGSRTSLLHNVDATAQVSPGRGLLIRWVSLSPQGPSSHMRPIQSTWGERLQGLPEALLVPS